MRHAASLLPSCLLGLVMGIVLLVSGQGALMPPGEVALASESGEDSATTAAGGVKIEHAVPSRLPPRRGDEGMSRVRPDDAIVRPLVDLPLLTAPTATGASLVAERLTYAAGATMSMRRRTQIRVVCLEAGILDARIDGSAFLDRRWPAGSLLTSEPHRVDGIVHLHPGDLLVVPPEAAFSARNAGELPAVSLEVSVQLPLPLTPMTDRVTTATGAGSVHREPLAAAIATDPGVSAVVAVARITVPPGESLVIDGTTGPVLVVVERGRLGVTQDGLDAEHAPGEAELVPPGEFATIHSTGEAPLAVLVLTATPAQSGPSPNPMAIQPTPSTPGMRAPRV
jgi:mannose-6-phosphate isomerase-like protein (cupin superfamily)